MSEQPKSEAIICNCGCKITKYDLSWTINPCLQHDPLTNAAPELLAACEALDEWEKNPPADGMTELAVIVLAARTAIAKAKETNDG